jgi:hypothetical protein
MSLNGDVDVFVYWLIIRIKKFIMFDVDQYLIPP